MHLYGTHKFLCAAVLLPLLCATALKAQGANPYVSWELLTPEISGKPGEVVPMKVRFSVAPGTHIYSLRTYGSKTIGPMPTSITVGDSAVLSEVGEIISDIPPTVKEDPNFEIKTEYWEGKVTLTIPVRIAEQTEQGEYRGWVNIYFMTCNDRLCSPPTDKHFAITVRVQHA